MAQLYLPWKSQEENCVIDLTSRFPQLHPHSAAPPEIEPSFIFSKKTFILFKKNTIIFWSKILLFWGTILLYFEAQYYHILRENAIIFWAKILYSVTEDLVLAPPSTSRHGMVDTKFLNLPGQFWGYFGPLWTKCTPPYPISTQNMSFWRNVNNLFMKEDCVNTCFTVIECLKSELEVIKLSIKRRLDQINHWSWR